MPPDGIAHTHNFPALVHEVWLWHTAFYSRPINPRPKVLKFNVLPAMADCAAAHRLVKRLACICGQHTESVRCNIERACMAGLLRGLVASKEYCKPVVHALLFSAVVLWLGIVYDASH